MKDNLSTAFSILMVILIVVLWVICMFIADLYDKLISKTKKYGITRNTSRTI